PAGLTTYHTLDHLGWFKAQNETRLALIDENEARIMAGRSDSKLILRGGVIRSSSLGIPSQVLDTLGKKIPNLNKEFVFIYNADWPGQDGALGLGEAAPYVGWVGLGLMLPFMVFIMTSRLWGRRDAALRDQFQKAFAGVAPAVNFA